MSEADNQNPGSPSSDEDDLVVTATYGSVRNRAQRNSTPDPIINASPPIPYLCSNNDDDSASASPRSSTPESDIGAAPALILQQVTPSNGDSTSPGNTIKPLLAGGKVTNAQTSTAPSPPSSTPAFDLEQFSSTMVGVMKQLIDQTEERMIAFITSEVQKSKADIETGFTKALQRSEAKTMAAVEKLDTAGSKLDGFVNKQTLQELRKDLETGCAEVETRIKTAVEDRCGAVERQIVKTAAELGATFSNEVEKNRAAVERQAAAATAELGAALRKETEVAYAAVEANAKVALETRCADVEQQVIAAATELRTAIAEAAVASDENLKQAVQKSEAVALERVKCIGRRCRSVDDRMRNNFDMLAHLNTRNLLIERFVGTNDKESYELEAIESDLHQTSETQKAMLEELRGQLETTRKLVAKLETDFSNRETDSQQVKHSGDGSPGKVVTDLSEQETDVQQARDCQGCSPSQGAEKQGPVNSSKQVTADQGSSGNVTTKPGGWRERLAAEKRQRWEAAESEGRFFRVTYVKSDW